MSKKVKKGPNISRERDIRKKWREQSLARWIAIANILAGENLLPDPWPKLAYAVSSTLDLTGAVGPFLFQEPVPTSLLQRVSRKWEALFQNPERDLISPEEAQDRLRDLRQDREFRDRYLSGDFEAQAEVDNLGVIAATKATDGKSLEERYQLTFALFVTLSRIAQAQQGGGGSVDLPAHPAYRSLSIGRGGRLAIRRLDDFGEFISILSQIDTRRIKKCESCCTIFLAKRKNQQGCTEAHRKSLSQRKWRAQTEARVETALQMLTVQKDAKAIAEHLGVNLKEARRYVVKARTEGNKLRKCSSCGTTQRRKDLLGSVTGNYLCRQCAETTNVPSTPAVRQLVEDSIKRAVEAGFNPAGGES